MVDGRQLGADHVTFQGIKKAGHLVHLERPCAYNRCLKQFLASLHADGQFTPSWKENRKSSPAFLINIYYHIICIMYHCFKLSSEINNSFSFFFFSPFFEFIWVTLFIHKTGDNYLLLHNVPVKKSNLSIVLSFSPSTTPQSNCRRPPLQMIQWTMEQWWKQFAQIKAHWHILGKD